MGGVRAGDDIFFTRTMAEVLEKQGYFEDALIIYKILADTDREDLTIKGKIEELKRLAERSRKKAVNRQAKD